MIAYLSGMFIVWFFAQFFDMDSAATHKTRMHLLNIQFNWIARRMMK